MGRAVRSDCAVTGEISLRGVVLPARNAPDLEDIPVDARNQLRFVLLETVSDALSELIGSKPSGIAGIAD